MTYQRHQARLLGIALCLLTTMTVLAQPVNTQESSIEAGYDVTQIAGLPDAQHNLKGRLTITDMSLMFTSSEFRAEIPFSRMTSVSAGDVRVETGGKTGKIARTLIPFGGGMALASVTQKSADLLTVEFTDASGGSHGTVFFVPTATANILRESLSPHLPTARPQEPLPCEAGTSHATFVVVEPIRSRGVELPAEYRVLLYESLIEELRDKSTDVTYLRAGTSDGAVCTAMKLKVTVNGFKKGNQALRASTGPVGLFVGKTSLSYQVELTTADGHRVLTEDMTNSKRMDTESLGVARSVAKAVAKKVHKVPTHTPAS